MLRACMHCLYASGAVTDDKADGMCADALVSGEGVPSRAGKMCRKCFGGYERYYKFHCTLKEHCL